MFKGWSSWLGAESEENEQKTAEEQHNTEPEESQHILQQARGLSGFILNFASSASKSISESVAETAQTIKKTAEESNIDGIIEGKPDSDQYISDSILFQTILGDFQKEQEKFVQEKNAKKTDAAVPPWVGYNEEETIQQQILALSADKRNFLRDPPAGVQFQFDFEQMSAVALVMLQEDELLNRMRFDLVPKQVKEDVFWRNYFYRVSLIKQSAQLTALAAQQQREEQKSAATPQNENISDTLRPKTPPVAISAEAKASEEEEDVSTSPGVSEFVSDAFDACDIKKGKEKERKEMEQLVLDKKDEEMADWEKQLQQELQEYEVVVDPENRDDNWDREIEEMLQDAS